MTNRFYRRDGRMGEKSERDREDSGSVRTDEVHQKNSEDPEMLKEYC